MYRLRFYKNKRLFVSAALIITLLLSVGCNRGGNTMDVPEDEISGEITGAPVDEQPSAGENQTAPEVTEAVIEAKEEEVLYPINLGTATIVENLIYSEDFEREVTQFTGRGSASASIVNKATTEEGHSLYITGRAATWNGANVNMTGVMKPGSTYYIKAKVYYEEGPKSLTVWCKVEKNGNKYLEFAECKAMRGEWTDIEGNITLMEDTNNAVVYFETTNELFDFTSFYVDDIEIMERQTTAVRGEIPSLKEVYKDYFKMGVAITPNELTDQSKELILEQFNSITLGNEMKPDSLLDYETCISDPKYDDNPAIRFDNALPVLDFAYENGIALRGHTLVWHSQTPRWFFAVGYSKDENAPLVSKELMLKRMENYIRQVITYMQDNYPGMVYAWDVVNEAMNSDGAPDGYRSKDSLWYQVCGPEYVEKAFEYARKYADEGVKLFYNDYQEYNTAKMLPICNMLKGLTEKGLVDGMGMQHHIGVDSPSVLDIQTAIEKYSELGLEIQITELDVDMPGNTEADYLRQAKRYKKLFFYYKMMMDQGKANITGVTFWGLTDNHSWLSDASGKSYPLLFDENYLPKLAFYGVLQSSEVPLL